MEDIHNLRFICLESLFVVFVLLKCVHISTPIFFQVPPYSESLSLASIFLRQNSNGWSRHMILSNSSLNFVPFSFRI